MYVSEWSCPLDIWAAWYLILLNWANWIEKKAFFSNIFPFPSTLFFPISLGKRFRWHSTRDKFIHSSTYLSIYPSIQNLEAFVSLVNSLSHRRHSFTICRCNAPLKLWFQGTVCIVHAVLSSRAILSRTDFGMPANWSSIAYGSSINILKTTRTNLQSCFFPLGSQLRGEVVWGPRSVSILRSMSCAKFVSGSRKPSYISFQTSNSSFQVDSFNGWWTREQNPLSKSPSICVWDSLWICTLSKPKKRGNVTSTWFQNQPHVWLQKKVIFISK